MATKKPTQKMVMKETDIAYRRRLLDRWGHLCVICGREFAHLACVTKEHIVPKSAPTHLKLDENLGPSHHTCNQLRGVRSIIETAGIIDERERKMHPNDFQNWLNRQVPNRIVPPHALKPLPRLPRYRQVPRFMELPEHLPGML